jgi:NAD(P)-dependent dehydrogenase (short-subunit alcohol dehydrogenase family)
VGVDGGGRLDGAVVLVTAAESGIGRGTARRAAARGAAVAAVGLAPPGEAHDAPQLDGAKPSRRANVRSMTSSAPPPIDHSRASRKKRAVQVSSM